jgi:pimeloyl-ACP methyl ester carboxylesterase
METFDAPAFFRNVHRPGGRTSSGWDDSTANHVKKTVGADKAELDRYSPTLLADRITAPVMLVHDGQDKIALVENAEKMREALTRAGRPPELPAARSLPVQAYRPIGRAIRRKQRRPRGGGDPSLQAQM